MNCERKTLLHFFWANPATKCFNEKSVAGRAIANSPRLSPAGTPSCGLSRAIPFAEKVTGYIFLRYCPPTSKSAEVI